MPQSMLGRDGRCGRLRYRTERCWGSAEHWL